MEIESQWNSKLKAFNDWALRTYNVELFRKFRRFNSTDSTRAIQIRTIRK